MPTLKLWSEASGIYLATASLVYACIVGHLEVSEMIARHRARRVSQ